MRPAKTSPLRVLTLIALALLLPACATQQPTTRHVTVPPPAIPPLPPEARQPPAPAWCYPTCSAALTAERESWLKRLTDPAPPGSPASEPTMR